MFVVLIKVLQIIAGLSYDAARGKSCLLQLGNVWSVEVKWKQLLIGPEGLECSVL